MSVLFFVCFVVWVVILFHYYFVACPSRELVMATRSSSIMQLVLGLLHFPMLFALYFFVFPCFILWCIVIIIVLSFIGFLDVLLFGLFRANIFSFVFSVGLLAFFILFIHTNPIIVFIHVQFVASIFVSYVYLLRFYSACLGRHGWGWPCSDAFSSNFWGLSAAVMCFMLIYEGKYAWIGALIFYILCLLVWTNGHKRRFGESLRLIYIQHYLLFVSGISLILLKGGIIILSCLSYCALLPLAIVVAS